VSPDELTTLIRDRRGQLRVDDVIINAGEAKLSGRGMLIFDRENLEIDLTLSGKNVPAHGRVITSKDFWRLSGFIAGELPFRCNTVSPGGRMKSSNGIVTITRSLNPIELVVDKRDSSKASRRRSAATRKLGFKPVRHKLATDCPFRFEATIVDCVLPAANGGTTTTWNNDFLGESSRQSLDTFSGETTAARYALITASNGNDLNIYFESKQGFESVSEEGDWRKFRTFLGALAFLNGVHPWPFRIRYWRDGHLLSELLRAPRRPARTDYSALSEAVGFNKPDAFGLALKSAAESLEPDTHLNRQVTHLLFLFREGGKESIQLEIRTLACCAVLESLIRLIFKEVCFGRTGMTDAIDPNRFARLKRSLLKQAGKFRNSKNVREHERICARIRDAAEFQIQDMFKTVGNKLGISWETTMQPLFSEWKKARNPAAHGNFKADLIDQKEVEQAFFGPSRIAGGFNMILLKLFGYSGVFRASAIEDQYQSL
jgi:hypothetical protein